MNRIIRAAELGHANNFQMMGMFMPDTRVEGLETALVYGRADNSTTPIVMASVDASSAVYKGSFELEKAFAHEFNDFHFSLLLGDWAQVFMTIIGLLVIVFALTGMYMWWPKRNVLRKATKMQTKGKLIGLLHNWHGLAGIWLSLIVLYFVITGAALSQPDWFDALLSRMDDPPAWEEKFKQDCGETVSLAQAEKMALAAFPNRKISSFFNVVGETQKYVFTLKGEHDIDRRMGDATAHVHARCEGQMFTSSLASEALPVKIGNQLLSLHGGHIFGPFSELFNIFAGVALAVLSSSGIFLFVKMTLPVSRRRGRLYNEPKNVRDRL